MIGFNKSVLDNSNLNLLTDKGIEKVNSLIDKVKNDWGKLKRVHNTPNNLIIVYLNSKDYSALNDSLETIVNLKNIGKIYASIFNHDMPALTDYEVELLLGEDINVSGQYYKPFNETEASVKKPLGKPRPKANNNKSNKQRNEVNSAINKTIIDSNINKKD